jgi:uncharacterized membrane-anchored protein
MPDKDFNRVLEVYLVEGWMTPEDYEAMDSNQIMIVQAIKRARQRLKNRNKQEKTYDNTL